MRANFYAFSQLSFLLTLPLPLLPLLSLLRARMRNTRCDGTRNFIAPEFAAELTIRCVREESCIAVFSLARSLTYNAVLLRFTLPYSLFLSLSLSPSLFLSVTETEKRRRRSRGRRRDSCRDSSMVRSNK